MDIIHNTSGFIQLNRTFHELPLDTGGDDSVETYLPPSAGEHSGWPDLLLEFRVIILSEAGAGKTKEIRNIAQQLRQERKAAFFLRLEYVPDDFEAAFEVGTFGEFTTWLSSNEEGWLLLDSIDEARLKSPKYFEHAIHKIDVKIRSALQRTHIVLTGRVSSWRARTDLELCKDHLPYTPPISSADPWKFMALDNLSYEQVALFATVKGVQDTQAFLREVERTDAWQFTTRPQDLEELVELWNTQKRIGSRSDFMENSITRRLKDRDQNRGEDCSLSLIELRERARLVAAAATLSKRSTIQVPDGSQNSQGFCIRNLLPDWQEKKLVSLLSRPIFDEAIYGTVRFHHRSVREYLTAEWLYTLLKNGASSRREIESLLFRNQYGWDVVIPTMRPVLPWLALWDGRICERILRIDPEVFFEGGDPVNLPVEIRRTILKLVCQQIADGTFTRSTPGYEAVKRFAGADLGSDVKNLLSQYAMDDNVIYFLFQIVEQGNVNEALPEAKASALSPSASKYTRIMSFRVVQAIGSPQDMKGVRESFLDENDELPRLWLAELINGLEPTSEAIDWFLAALTKSQAKEKFHDHGLQDAVTGFVQRTPRKDLPKLLAGLHAQLNTKPTIEHLRCKISQKFAWLLAPALCALERLAEAHDPFSLDIISLDLPYKAANANTYFAWDRDLQERSKRLSAMVPAWPELNRALFWHDAELCAQQLYTGRPAGQVGYHAMLTVQSFWRFGNADFDYALEQISAQECPKRKFLALDLAFRLYVDGKCRQEQRERLEDAVKLYEYLIAGLDKMLHPPTQEEPERIREQDTQRAAEKERRKQEREKWVASLRENPDILRHNGLVPVQMSGWQHFLYEETNRLKRGPTHYSLGNWQCLIEEFGTEVAEAYRDGAIKFWRNHVPAVYSEGAPIRTIAPVIFGLSGLQMEAESTSDWPASLTPEEVKVACRYAIYEINGLPYWFQRLFTAFPNIVGSFLLEELKYELSVEQETTWINYVLFQIRFYAPWIWEYLACPLFSYLQKAEPVNVKTLDHLLTIIQGTSSPDEDVARLAKEKIQIPLPSPHVAHWFAMWVGVEPDKAITALKVHLASIPVDQDATGFAIQVAISLIGDYGIHQSLVTRKAFHKPEWLKQLYLLMHKYIRVGEDTNRAGGEVYSPTPRDHAQSARERFVGLLREIPGKETFLALQEIAEDPPAETWKWWFLQNAKSRAEQDADFEAWSPFDVYEFHKNQEKTPSNPEELANLAYNRLLDLKDDLEHGNDSIVPMMKPNIAETEMRNFIAYMLRSKACGRYNISQEYELADGRKPDLLFQADTVDAPVPVELKLADNWTGPKLFERMENQLCGDYLRDMRSSYGIFALVNRDPKQHWELPELRERVNFEQLVNALKEHWKTQLNPKFPTVERVDVVGIDLTKRLTS